MRPGAAMKAHAGVPDIIIDGETGGIESQGGGGGWAWILSDLKTLLESGSPMAS